jgi:multisubunit Na+/H+ antiporter MnhB subunit
MNEKPERPPTPVPPPLPEGYRQGIITAITVLLGFSLAFFRFWGFEAGGEWTGGSIVAASALVVAVLMQFVALVRSLRLEDNDPGEYRKTMRWFTASAAVLLVAVLIAVLASSG